MPNTKVKLSSADMQEDIAKYVNKATMLIHSKETTTAIQKMLSARNPVQQVARLTVAIVQKIDTASRSAGVETKDTAKIIAMAAIIELLCELADAAGKFRMDDDYKLLALTTSVQDYFKTEIESGRINPKQLEMTIGQGMETIPKEILNGAKQTTGRLPQIAAKYNQSQKPMGRQGVDRGNG